MENMEGNTAKVNWICNLFLSYENHLQIQLPYYQKFQEVSSLQDGVKVQYFITRFTEIDKLFHRKQCEDPIKNNTTEWYNNVDILSVTISKKAVYKCTV